MRRDNVIATLAAHRAELRRLGIGSLHVFGSVARGEALADSDVDLLVEFDRPVGLVHFVSVKRRLADLLGAPVDLVTLKALRPAHRERVLGEAVRAA